MTNTTNSTNASDSASSTTAANSTKQLFDISTPIRVGMAVYKNKAEKQPDFTITSNFPAQSVRETRLHLDAHTGTHVDAPLHMIPNGATIETISLSRLLRNVKVLDLTTVNDRIHAADVESLDIQQGDFILLKTKNSFSDTFDADFVFVSEDAAKVLARRGIDGVGVDGLGIERSQPEHPTHKALFDADVIIIEGLRLADITPGEYEMIALPLALAGIDAAPARIVLRSL